MEKLKLEYENVIYIYNSDLDSIPKKNWNK